MENYTGFHCGIQVLGDRMELLDGRVAILEKVESDNEEKHPRTVLLTNQ